MATILWSWIPSSNTASSSLLPEEATSPCAVLRAAQVRNERRTTATVTNCWFRSTSPSRYIATERDANIADFRLQATFTPQNSDRGDIRGILTM